MVGTLASEHLSAVTHRPWRPSPPASQANHGQRVAHDVPDAIPTGFPALDGVLGIGGLPMGRIAEFSGRPDSGQATLALRFLARAQGEGKVAYINLSGNFDPNAARRNGLYLASNPAPAAAARERVTSSASR